MLQSNLSTRMFCCSVVVLALTFRYTLGDNQRPVAQCIDDDTACTRGCQPGYRGSFCNETCSEHCGGACSQDTGHCLTGCKPNWFTPTCSQPCSGNCVDNVCDRRSAECIRGCKDGFYGLNCNETCSENCTEGKCDIHGGCHCKKGVLDKFCYIDCTDNCIEGLCAVDHDGQLKCLKGCKEGRTGAFCKEWCPHDCPACDSTCVTRVIKRRLRRDSPNNCRENSNCQDGYRGPNCDISCQACRYDRLCNLFCAAGSWGAVCHYDCPQNCARAWNGESLCNFDHGLCDSGCRQGYFGYKCNHTCPTSCHENYCYLHNGSCSEGCDPEYWGPKCEYQCSKCKDMKCEQNGSCTCIEGYYGPWCEVKCSERCKGNCSITMHGSHICEPECETGFTGVDCQARCPSECRSGCNKRDGTCSETPLPPVSKCISPCRACHEDSPRLCLRCETGKYGPRCDHICSNCLGNRCSINGDCIDGCKSSWWGLKCDLKCQCDYDCDRRTGQHKANVSLCPEHCRKIYQPECRNCITTRQCLYGCEGGFTGSQCELTLVEEVEQSTVSPRPSSSCEPPCIQCRDDSTCVECPGPNGEICRTCGQDGSCLDECGAGCLDFSNSSKATTESIVEEAELSTVSPKATSICPPPCIQCSDDSTCVECPGPNGKICRTCGQDGSCQDECGAGCLDFSTSRATTESIVEDMPQDILDQIEQLFKNNALLLPLLCCSLVLIVMVFAFVASKFRKCKGLAKCNRDQREISHTREESVFAKCGDTYHELDYLFHELDEMESNTRPTLPPRPPVHGIPPQPLPNERADHGHTRTIQETQDHTPNCNGNDKINSDNETHHYDYAIECTENQSYVTPVHEPTGSDSSSTRDSNLQYVTPISEGIERLSPNDIPNLNIKSTMGTSKESSYVTAISEAEQRELISRGERCTDVINGSVSAVEVDNGEKSESDQLERGTCAEPEVKDPIKYPEVRDQLETGTCTEPNVRDQLETGTCTEPEVRDQLETGTCTEPNVRDQLETGSCTEPEVRDQLETGTCTEPNVRDQLETGTCTEPEVRDQLETGTCTEPNVRDQLETGTCIEPEVRDQLETGTCTEPNVRDQLETGTCTEPEVRDQLETGTCTEPEVRDPIKYTEVRDQLETGTCTEPNVRDQLETGTYTEPDVRDPLLRSSGDTGEMSETTLLKYSRK